MSRNIKEFTFDTDSIFESLHLFPEEISGNKFMLYHGTSSCFEKRIENEGLKWSKDIFTKEQVIEVTNIFETIQWTQNPSKPRGRGYWILSGFTLKDDFGDNKIKPIYFAETSYRATLYASKEYAGGETIRGLRQAFEDLNYYLSIQDISKTNRSFVQEKLNYHKELINKVNALYNNHNYGVVYAINFENKGKELLKYLGSAGMITNGVESDVIVAKVKIPNDFKYKNLGNEIGYSKNSYWREILG